MEKEKKKWVWFSLGYAAFYQRFHIQTLVGNHKYLISTMDLDPRKELEYLHPEHYESMCFGALKDALTNRDRYDSGKDYETRRYKNIFSAVIGHIRMCRKWDEIGKEVM